MPIRGPRDVPERVSVTHAGKRLADLVLAVQSGRTIILTRYRQPIAKLVPFDEEWTPMVLGPNTIHAGWPGPKSDE